MKEVRGIKAFAIGAVIANGTLLILMVNLFVQFSRLRSKMDSFEAIMMMIITALVAISIIYPVQLLLMRKKYYGHVPVTSAARLFLHITRIIQFLFSLFMVFALAAALIDLYKHKSGTRNGAFYMQMGMLLLLLAAIVLNFLVFFKGWRLLRLARSNYIDEVMKAFD